MSPSLLLTALSIGADALLRSSWFFRGVDVAPANEPSLVRSWLAVRIGCFHSRRGRCGAERLLLPERLVRSILVERVAMKRQRLVRTDHGHPVVFGR